MDKYILNILKDKYENIKLNGNEILELRERIIEKLEKNQQKF